MKISVITPALPTSSGGNTTTAHRLASILIDLGHDVRVDHVWSGAEADVMVALHAWRSAASIRAFRAQHPRGRLIVVLTGTDVYEFQHSHPERTLDSMGAADVLVGLHDRVAEDLPPSFRARVRVIRQSASLVSGEPEPDIDRFDVLVVAHLRDVKDPLRAAYAVRTLPAGSRIYVTHLGAARTPAWKNRVEAEARTNARYAWRGPVPRIEVGRHLARSRLLVVASRAEGGANVVSEAIVAGTAVVASNVSGNVGLLGADYPALFPVGDTAALAALLRRAEVDPKFIDRLRQRCSALLPTFERSTEVDAWRKLIAQMEGGG